MEIELPDGTVLEAPEGADVKRVVQGYQRKKTIMSSLPEGADTPEGQARYRSEYDPKSQEYKDKYGTFSKGRTVKNAGGYDIPADNMLAEGIGSGMLRMGKGLNNTMIKLLNKHPVISAMGGFPNPVGDEELNRQDAVDKELSEQPQGFAGQIIGQTAAASGATLPLGGLAAGARGASVLARTLGHPTTRAAIEGGLTGAGAAKAGEEGKGALTGAAIGGGVERVFAGAGRAIRGLVQKSDSAEDLQHIAGQHGEDLFIPISQAASPEGDLTSRVIRTGYAEGLPLVPGVAGQFRKQASQGLEKTREIALREASPEGTLLPDRPGHNVNESVSAIRKGFDSGYDNTVKTLDFLVPQTFDSDVATSVRAAMKNVDDTTVERTAEAANDAMQRFSSGQNRIEGENLLNVKNELSKAASGLAGPEKVAMIEAVKHIEKMIEGRLSRQSGTLYEQYRALAEPYRQFKGLRNAANAARTKGGRFSMSQLGSSSRDPTQAHLATVGNEVFSQSPAGTSFAGRQAVGGAGVLGLGATAGFPAAVAVLTGANLLATKTAQKAMMGDLAAQRMVAKILRKHPELSNGIEKLMSKASIVSSEQE